MIDRELAREKAGTGRMRGKRSRGSALIIVLVIATAALIATYGILESSLNSRVAVVRTVDGDLSDGIARAGIERTVEYLRAFGASDYDNVLDPNWNASCDPASGTFTPSTGGHQPVFTEGGIQKDVKYPPDVANAREYTLVPYNGGAYLVRFDDDADDMVRAPAWNSFTNQNLGVGHPDCIEGIESTGPSLLTHDSGGMENPVRDRNRSIWIEVIGIYPGTDVNNVKYKTVVRKRHSYVPSATVTGMVVKGDIQVSGSGGLYACSPIGSLEVGGNVQTTSGAARLCSSGDSLADDWQPNGGTLGHCSEATFAGDCRTEVAPGSLGTPGPTPPLIQGLINAADHYIDWTRPCLFFVNPGDNDLWFWDANGRRGPRRDVATSAPMFCRELEGRGKQWPGPPAPDRAGIIESAANLDANNESAGNWAGCWTPLIMDMSGACDWAFTHPSLLPADVGPDESGTDGSPAACAWKPDGADAGAITINLGVAGDMNTVLSAHGYNQFPVPATADLTWNKPAWATECQIVYPPFPSAAQTQETYNCTTCDGTNAALAWNNAASWVFFKAQGVAYDLNRMRALPAGVYFYNNNWVLSGTNIDFQSAMFPVPATGLVPPEVVFAGNSGDPAPAADWPLATVATNGNFTHQQWLWLGIGQDFAQNAVACRADPSSCPDGGAYYSSLISKGDTTMSGTVKFALAGSVWADGNLNWAGGNEMFLFGEVHLQNNGANFYLTGSGDFHWLYSNALQQPPTIAGGQPIIHRARQ